MNAVAFVPPAAPLPKRAQSPLAYLLLRLSHQPTALLALSILGVLVLSALLSPVLAPRDPNAQVLADRFRQPGAEYLLGADHLGRDQLSRLLAGLRTSLLASVEAMLIALVLGSPLGLLSGFVGSWLDGIVSRVFDALQSIPPLILAMAIVAASGRNLTSAMVAIGIVFAPRMFRVTRAATIGVSRETYIEAARSVGGRTGTIVVEHVLPNVLSPLVVQVSLSLAFGMLAEAALSFLGLGVQPPGASLGSMLNTAVPYMERASYLVIEPGLALFTVVVCLSTVADGLRRALGRDDHQAP